MKKTAILNKLENAGVIAVVRGETVEEAIKASNAIVKGGITGIELTFTVPNADHADCRISCKLVKKIPRSLLVRYCT